MCPAVTALIALLGFIFWVGTQRSCAPVVPRLVGTGKYAVKVDGTSNCAENLAAICNARTDSGVDVMLGACLILENDDKFERQAIRVSIRSHTVGYLPRTNARDFRRAATYVGLGRTRVFECSALIRGARDNDRGTDSIWSVWLDLPNDGLV